MQGEEGEGLSPRLLIIGNELNFRVCPNPNHCGVCDSPYQGTNPTDPLRATCPSKVWDSSWPEEGPWPLVHRGGDDDEDDDDGDDDGGPAVFVPVVSACPMHHLQLQNHSTL